MVPPIEGGSLTNTIVIISLDLVGLIFSFVTTLSFIWFCRQVASNIGSAELHAASQKTYSYVFAFAVLGTVSLAASLSVVGFGNAGLIAAGSIIPVSTPGLLRKVPGYLLDPTGPLRLRWSYLPKALPWLHAFLRHGNAAKVATIADGLSTLLHGSLEEHLQLAKLTGALAWIRSSRRCSSVRLLRRCASTSSWDSSMRARRAARAIASWC